MRPPVELGFHRAPRCEPVVSLVRSRRAHLGERCLEANKKCGTQSDLGSAACRLLAEAGVGTVAEMVFEGVEYVIMSLLLRVWGAHVCLQGATKQLTTVSGERCGCGVWSL